MGTNYYLSLPTCPHCTRLEEKLHIGKSSMGWCFSLHVMPERGILDLEDWEATWAQPGMVIRNEYGEVLTPGEMLQAVIDRQGKSEFDKPYRPHGLAGMTTWNQFHAVNHSEPGPNGLLRHKLMKGHCVKHGAGTWDCIIGEFS